MQEKRNAFPRFLFLADDDLLEVMGQSSNEKVMQTQLKKIFVGIDGIVLDKEKKNITAIYSSQGETVSLSTRVNIQHPIEVLL